MKKIKVMIVDDSAVVRQVLQTTLNNDASIEVIGVAADPGSPGVFPRRGFLDSSSGPWYSFFR